MPESLHPPSCQAPGHCRVIARQGLLPREEGAQSTLVARERKREKGWVVGGQWSG